MTEQELIEFRQRCHTSIVYGRKIANAEVYAAELEKEAGPVPLAPGTIKHSAPHLIALVEKVLRVRSGEKPAKAEPTAAEKAAKKAKAEAAKKAKEAAEKKAKAEAEKKAKAEKAKKAKEAAEKKAKAEKAKKAKAKPKTASKKKKR